MYETDIQKRVSVPIMDKEVDKIRATLTENHGTVIIEVQHNDGRIRDAAYTAEETRKLAQAIEVISGQRWDVSNRRLILYLEELADVVDGNKDPEEVKQQWNDEDVNITYEPMDST